MSKKKKSGENKPALEKLVYITAAINLLKSYIDLISAIIKALN